MIYVLIILLVIVLMVMFVYIGLYYRACGRNQDDLQDLAEAKAKWDKFEALANLYEEQNKDLQAKLLQKENDAGFVQGQQVQGELQVRDVAAELDNLKAQKEIEALKVSGLALTNYEFLQALAKSKETQLQIENVSHGLENRNREVLEEISELEKKKNSLALELNRLLNIQKVIDDDEDGVVWEPILTEKQAKLVQLLRELILMYPDLEIDFATIEWKKIWMPQLQQLGKTIDGKRGIYRLILKDNKMPPFQAMRDGVEITLPYCYVGQAVNIKERWYQHVKKMIGVMSKGNERVYEWRPEDFKWCIVESGNIDLDASEKYWIQYFAAKEGLNKKL